MAMFENIFDYAPFLLQKEKDSFTKAPLGTIKIKIKKKSCQKQLYLYPMQINKFSSIHVSNKTEVETGKHLTWYVIWQVLDSL